MKKSMTKLLPMPMFMLMLMAFLSLPGLLPSLGAAAELTVITTTDLQGELLPNEVKTKAGDILHTGGVAMLSSYIQHIKNTSKGPVILLDVGDSFQGTLESNSLEGAPIIDLFNHLGYDALTIGNLEFDFGPSGSQRFILGADPLGALKDRIAQANFPFLAINITDKDGKLIEGVRPSILIDRGGVKVGVIGAITPNGKSKTFPPNVEDLNFLDPLELVIEEAQRLRRVEKVDFVVFAYHAGERCDDNGPNEDISTCSQEIIFPLIDKLPHGLIDLIVGGDTHKLLAKYYKGTGLLQAGYKARGLAWAKLSTGQTPELNIVEVCDQSFIDEAGRGRTCQRDLAENYDGQLQNHLLLGQAMAPDPTVEAMVEKQIQRVSVLKNRETLAFLEDDFAKSSISESPLSNWFVDMLNNAISLHGIRADFVVYHNGAMRNSLDKGLVTFGDIFAILPFDHNLATITVTGAQLKKFVALVQDPHHAAYSYSGLTFKLNGVCELVEIKIDDGTDVANVEDNTTYTLATNDFLGRGGVNFDKDMGYSPNDIEIHHTLPLLRDIVFEYLKKLSQEERKMSSVEFYNPKQPRQDFPSHCRAH